MKSSSRVYSGPSFASRRGFLSNAGATTLSASALVLLSGCASKTAAAAQPGKSDPDADIRILNTAIGAEHEAVAAYQVGAESGLLSAGVLAVAIKFQSQHKEHVDALAAVVAKLGGQAVEPAATYSFPVEKLKNETDVLTFAAGLERGAVSAYVGAIPIFADRTLSAAAASILADEAMHWAILRNALGQDPVPDAFYT